ncbi:MAG: glycosyltransferase [Acidobacteriota bacterium]
MDRKLKMVIFTLGFFTGGTERQIIELVKGIDRNRFDCSIAVARPGGELECELASYGLKIESFPITSLRDLNGVRQLLRLRKFLIEKKIELLHTFSLLGNTFGVLAGLLARIPIIITSRRDMNGTEYLPPYGRCQSYFSHWVDHITTNAVAIKGMLVAREKVSPDKISVIENGLDLSQFSNLRDRSEIRQQLGISEDAPVIGMVAVFKPIKGHIYLFQAVKQLLATFPQLRVLLIGGCPLDANINAELLSAVKELGIENNIVFIGASQQVPRLLTSLNISALPSLSEGISNAILESMAAGVPVVATNVGGNVEIIKDGETGLLVPARDSNALAAALLRLLNDREYGAHLAANASKMVAHRFSNRRMVNNFESLYVRLTESKLQPSNATSWFGSRRRLAQ